MTLDAVFKEEWARVLGALAHRFRDLDLAEECAQDAFERAARTWPRDGMPQRPRAWLLRVAANRAVDILRARRDEPLPSDDTRMKYELVDDAFGETDDRLRLLLMCAHPALALETRLALMLRCVTGLSVAQIAAAFLVSEATVAQRLVRGKRKIKNAGISFDVEPQHVADRVDAVRTAIYLLFNEGYTSADSLSSAGFSNEALYLARLLYELFPADAENGGLYALLLLHQSRSGARFDDGGNAVPLGRQDPARYDRPAFRTAIDVLNGALSRRSPGRYQIEAAISALHTQGASYGHTDWRQIADLYDRLSEVHPSPVVDVNRAVAAANAGDARRGLEILAPVLASGILDAYGPLHVAHGDLLQRTGASDRARFAFQRALRCSDNAAHRAEIARRLQALSAES